MLRRWGRLLVIGFMLCAPTAVLAEDALRLGVLAFRPREQAMAEYKPLADYLQRTLGRPVRLQTYGLDDLELAVAQQDVDVVFTNPGQYIQLRYWSRLSDPLATQIRREFGQELATIGGVIVTRADSSPARTLADLRGRTVAVSNPEALGSYQMQAFEMIQAGLAPPLSERLVVTGLPHDRVLEAVLQGRAEAGFVRAGVMEQMAKEGRLDASLLRVIDPKPARDFPYALSTRQYPEWPVAVLPHVSEQDARRLAVALLSMPPQVMGQRGDGIAGFTLPADYRPVEALLRALRVPPFNTAVERTLGEIWAEHAATIAAVLALLVLAFAALGARLRLQNRRLLQSQQRFTTLFESAPEPMWIIDEGRFVECNTAAVRKLGYGDKASTLQRRPEEISPQRQPDGELSETKAQRILARVQQGEPQRFEWVHRKADGSEFTADVSLAQATLNGRGVILCSWYDITTQKNHERALQALTGSLEQRVAERTGELQRQRQFQEAVVNATGSLVFVLDRKGCFVQVNAAFERLTGFRQENLKGEPFWESVIPASRRALVKARHQHLTPRAKLTRDIEVEWVTREGTPLLILLNNAILTDERGELEFIVVSGIDVTERKRAERALLLANQRLSKSLENLQQTQAELVQSEKMAALGGLVAGIAHEINTPLGIGVTAATALQEQVKLLERAFDAGDLRRSAMQGFLAQAKEGCVILVRNLLRAADLIRSFKQVAVDQSSHELRTFDLRSYIDEVLLSLQPRLRGHGVRVINDCAANLQVHTDPGAIYQVLSNLVINALVHGYEEGQAGVIRIDARRVGHEVVLDCIDDGRGVPPEIRDRIFDPFFTTRRGSGGSGLGLHIVFNLVVQTLHGVIYLEKEVERGATFRIRFPMTLEQTHEHTPTS